jgi:alpha-L-fucosidase
MWSIAEADTSIFANGWFENHSPGQERNKVVKTMKELGDIYFESVGRGGVLLLNFGPNIFGVLSDVQVKRGKEFGDALRDTFALNYARGAAATATSHRGNSEKFSPANVLDGDYDTYWTMDDGKLTGAITIDLGESKSFDVVAIQEYIPLGQRVSRFKVEVYSNSAWAQFGDPGLQQTIGYKALVRGSVATASKVRVTVLESQAVPVINTIGIYKTANKDFELQPR